MGNKTRFATERLVVNGLEYWLDGNGKIAWDNGTFEEPRPNAFSLVQIQDCPGSTPTCREACYVHRLEAAEAEVHGKYRINSRSLRAVLPYARARDDLARALGRWISTRARGGFRWHVSGDLISTSHAEMVRDAARYSPAVRQWIYTRSIWWVHLLVGLPNLVVNVSADVNNYRLARETAIRYNLRLCYMTVGGEVPSDLRPWDVVFPSHELRGRDLPVKTDAPWWQGLGHDKRKLVCPPEFFGQSEALRCGPCDKCLVHPS